jgi:hypothetical protein
MPVFKWYIMLMYPLILFTLFSGVKATYLLAVAFLEILRFSCNGGILSATSTLNRSNSAFSCVFEYLLTPNLTPAVTQCLTAVAHRAFETVLSWLVHSSLEQSVGTYLACVTISCIPSFTLKHVGNWKSCLPLCFKGLFGSRPLRLCLARQVILAPGVLPDPGS